MSFTGQRRGSSALLISARPTRASPNRAFSRRQPTRLTRFGARPSPPASPAPVFWRSPEQDVRRGGLDDWVKRPLLANWRIPNARPQAPPDRPGPDAGGRVGAARTGRQRRRAAGAGVCNERRLGRIAGPSEGQNAPSRTQGNHANDLQEDEGATLHAPQPARVTHGHTNARRGSRVRSAPLTRSARHSGHPEVKPPSCSGPARPRRRRRWARPGQTGPARDSQKPSRCTVGLREESKKRWQNERQ
jgi:hypothetical protein